MDPALGVQRGAGGKAGSSGSGGSGGSTGGAGGSAGGSAGTAGSDGGAGKGGSAGMDAGGSDAPTPTMTCGTRTCSPVMSTVGTWAPCCPMGETDACGGLVNIGTIMNTCITATFGLADFDLSKRDAAGQTILAAAGRMECVATARAGWGSACADQLPSRHQCTWPAAGDASRHRWQPRCTRPRRHGSRRTRSQRYGSGDTGPGDTVRHGRPPATPVPATLGGRRPTADRHGAARPRRRFGAAHTMRRICARGGDQAVCLSADVSGTSPQNDQSRCSCTRRPRIRKLFVVYPGPKRYALQKNVEVGPLRGCSDEVLRHSDASASLGRRASAAG